WLLQQTILFQLLAQGAAVQAQHGGSFGLVVASVAHDLLQQVRLDFGKNHLVDIRDRLAVQLGKVVLQAVFHAVTQRLGLAGPLVDSESTGRLSGDVSSYNGFSGHAANSSTLIRCSK